MINNNSVWCGLINSCLLCVHRSIAMAIIRCPAWERALNCKWVNKKWTNPFKELIKEMPGKNMLFVLTLIST